MDRVIIATRRSPLALSQARLVQSLLQSGGGLANVEIREYTTKADRFLDRPLSAIGGKALFTKEIEQAVLRNEADIAVHCGKDMPTLFPPGLVIAAVLESEDPSDCFISPKFSSLAELPQGARVGTASLRRQAYVKGARPDVALGLLRGNVNTRLKKLETDFEATILATAGLKRLNLTQHIRQTLDPTVWIPAVGQGILCLQVREGHESLRRILANLDHPPTKIRWEIERHFMAALDGSCRLPIAGYVPVAGPSKGTLFGMVGSSQNLLYAQGQLALHDVLHGPSAPLEALAKVKAFALDLKNALQRKLKAQCASQ